MTTNHIIFEHRQILLTLSLKPSIYRKPALYRYCLMQYLYMHVFKGVYIHNEAQDISVILRNQYNELIVSIYFLLYQFKLENLLSYLHVCCFNGHTN